MKDKLFFICANMTSGGAERVISILSNKFQEGYDVRIITWYMPEIFYQLDESVNIVSFEKEAGTRNLIKKILWFRKYVKKESPSIVISFMYSLNLITLLSLIGVKQKIIISERTDPRCTPHSKLLRIVRYLLYFRTHGLVAQTRDMLDYFPKLVKNKGTYIYNPINISQEVIGKALVTTKKKVIVSVGRLIERKNQKILIDAYRNILDVYPEYRLVIYGEGEYRGELEKYIDELHLADFVQLPGTVKNIFEKLCEAEIFVLPSDYEGMSNALIEAMCVGLPCISTKVSGSTELIVNNTNGILIDVNSCEQLTVALSELIANKRKERDIGAEAISIYDELNVNSIVNQWSNYIKKIIND